MSSLNENGRFPANKWVTGKRGVGSASAIQNPDGTVEQARYLPFGDWRTQPEDLPTNRGFTGHVHNNLGGGADDLGLIYMNARFYVPGIGRFASADTIVPDPASPQQYNRYSYTLNNPLNLVDPSGHCASEQFDTECWAQYDALYQHFKLLSETEKHYNFTHKDIIRKIGVGESYRYQEIPEGHGSSIVYLFDKAMNCGSDFDCSNNKLGHPMTSYEPPCQQWMACYEPVITKGEMSPDALILPGGSGSAAGGIYTVGGAELLLNRRSNEVSGFTYMGQGGGVALEADVSVYGGLVWNLDENIDYSGPFTTLTIDLSAVIGGQGSFFWESGTIPFTGKTWGFSLGPSGGGGFGVTGSQTEFTCVIGC